MGGREREGGREMDISTCALFFDLTRETVIIILSIRSGKREICVKIVKISYFAILWDELKRWINNAIYDCAENNCLFIEKKNYVTLSSIVSFKISFSL